MRFLLSILFISFFQLNVSAQLHLYWSSSSSSNIQRVNLQGENQEIAVDLQNTPRGLAVDYEHGRLYFADGEHYSITSAKLDGTEAYSIISATKPIDIAFDKAKQMLYYTDNESHIIAKVRTDGSENETIISSVSSPAFLDIDFINELIFFTSQVNNSSKIYRSNFDGTNITELISSLSIIPGIALDVADQKIYWLERGSDLLKRSDYDGSNTISLGDAGKSSIALELDDINGVLYWSNKDKNQIIKSNLSGSNISVFKEDIVAVGGIALDIKNGCYRVETTYDTISVTDTLFIDVDLSPVIGISKINKIKMFPNPTNKILNITTGSSYSVIKDYSIKIVSPTGAEVFNKKINVKEFSIELSSFATTGLFLVSILDESGNLVHSKKIVLY